MNIKKKLTIALAFGILAVSSTAGAGVCQGTSTAWNQFVENGCSGRGNWWGNWLNGNKRFGTTAHAVLSTDKTVIAAVNSAGTVISSCIAEDTTPGNGQYNYRSGGSCNSGVKYVYQAHY